MQVIHVTHTELQTCSLTCPLNRRTDAGLSDASPQQTTWLDSLYEQRNPLLLLCVIRGTGCFDQSLMTFYDVDSAPQLIQNALIHE